LRERRRPLPDAPEPSASPNARFLAGAVPHGADERLRFGNSIIGSAFTHVGGFLLALFIIGSGPVTPPWTDPVDDKLSDLVWLNVPGSGRRGGGPGDGKPEPPRKADRPGRDTMTLSVAAPPRLAHEPLKPDAEINIPNTSAGVVDLPGALTGLATIPSQGSDGRGGAGLGTGARGSGFGTDYDDGIGTGAFGPGNGITMPTVLTE